ncbi:BamA/TamA family outer membrane protein [Ferruginibacter albus]|uniref:hypothetical protein n=1 Tax=Ferruginibacter albus TaxID=2875540 RepID=UPI001CC82AAA|nr:hypothetical protein [Ferruginibacter albus]UAY52920.1 hypothetical protein K9M53_04385 [Ferruginibacter albus]
MVRFFLLLIVLIPLQSIAQDSLHADAMQQQTDVINLFHHLLHQQTHRSDTGTVNISVLPGAGYSTATGFAGVLSAAGAFYIEKHHAADDKISNIITSLTYSQYNQIIFPIQASIWTKHNEFNITTDWRYLKYPSTTFGLGGKSDINNGYTINFNYIKLHQTVLKSVAKNLFTGFGYYYDYFWNVKQVNPPVGIRTDFQRYGLTPTVAASGPVLRFLYDSRLNQINPSDGWYGNVVYRSNLTAMGSDENWQSLLIDVRKYIHLSPSSKNILAFWSYNLFTVAGKPPYLLLPSTGWDDFYNTGRGYIQGRYRGRNMLYLESEYRFGILNNGLIGGVVFLNAESLPREISRQFDVIAPACGVGLRLKLNKFSKTNVCIDYGIGMEGSKGISVNLGEVF